MNSVIKNVMKSKCLKFTICIQIGLFLFFRLEIVFSQVIPSINENYIIKSSPRIPNLKSEASLNNQTVDNVNATITFLDGMGRDLQIIQWKASPFKNDIIQQKAYDAAGREQHQFLPFSTNDNIGNFKTDAIMQQWQFYLSPVLNNSGVTAMDKAYAVTVFEESPLSRVVEQGAPGSPWQPFNSNNVGSGHTQRSEYSTNNVNEVLLWTLNASTPGATASYYSAGQLYKTTFKDENWAVTAGKSGTVEEYKDFENRIVLKRVWESESKALDTYYVYDDFGDLRYIIPSAVMGTGFSELSTDPTYANFDNYIYAYRYDGRRRLIEKKIPGKGWEYLVYNLNDQVVLTQDAEQRVRKEWSYSRYDAFGRITSNGLYTNTVKLSRADVSNLVDIGLPWETRAGTDYPAPATTFPLAGPGIMIMPRVVYYYDDYAFAGATTLPAIGITKSTKIKSLQTGTKVYRTDGTQPLLTVLYYDDYGRMIQSASKNHLGGTDYVTNTYNFPGELLTSTRVHTPATGSATTIITTNEYDHVGRLVSTKEKIGSQAEVILASNSYNEIGQLKSKAVGKSGTETSFVNTTTYSYNERGWLSKSTSPKFSQQLKYQDGTNPQWNGNISQQLWGDDATLPNTFSYQYDRLNRLTSGSNGQTGAASMAEVITYDDLGMGNIKTLKRDALTATTYTYTGNKLMSLSGGLTGSYTYDANGSVKTDRMGMAITYNYLNLPQTAKKAGVDVAFLYDAMGTKLQKLSKIGTAPNVITTTRDYVGGIEYNNGAIDIIHNSEGYALKSGANYIYHYNLTDHLGNVRATLKRGSSSTAVDVAQRDNYYPFGKRKVVAGGNNNYLYNGKEIQGELGDQYDYGARFYDAEIGRWNVIDPLAEKSRRWSPYNYTLNNPIRFIDPDGMEWADPNSKKIGERLQSLIQNRLKMENSFLTKAQNEVSKIQAKIDKEGISEKLSSKLESAQSEVASISERIGDLNSSYTELAEMGSKDVSQKFAFNEISGARVGFAYKENGIITMDIASDANGVHEAVHGYQIYKSGGLKATERIDIEVPAYQRQYSFDSQSVSGISSLWGGIKGRNDINKNWVMGINSNGKMIYMPAFGISEMRKLLNNIRNGK